MNKGVNNEPNNHQDVQIHQKGIKYHVRTGTAEICQLNMAFSGVSRALSNIKDGSFCENSYWLSVLLNFIQFFEKILSN